VGRPLSPAEVLALLPQKRPFLFVDEITHLDEAGATGVYRFRDDELFYAGHFPGNPVTPGVILLEAMAQIGVVAHSIYLYALDHETREIDRHLIVFAEANVEFFHMVRPGDQITVKSQKIFFRRKKTRSKVELFLEDGRLAATATMAGIGVEKS